MRSNFFLKSKIDAVAKDATYPLRKNLSFPKHLKITQKFTQNCQIVDNVLSIGIWRRLKRDRDIGRKAVLSDVKTAFTFTPALTDVNRSIHLSVFRYRLNKNGFAGPKSFRDFRNRPQTRISQPPRHASYPII